MRCAGTGGEETTMMHGKRWATRAGDGKDCCLISSRYDAAELCTVTLIGRLKRKQSETYTPVSPEIARRYSINYDPAVHGRSGPVQVSYPNYFYPQSSKCQGRGGDRVSLTVENS